MADIGPAGPPTRNGRNAFAPAWAVVGVVGLFALAIWRLGHRGVEVIGAGLSGLEWAVLVVLTAAFVVGEGVVALDRRWVPRFLARVRDLRTERRRYVRLLAPLYGLSLVGVSPAGLVRGWLGTAAIVAAVLVIRGLPDPWRGIVDFAVAAALAWGFIAIVRRLPGREFREPGGERETGPAGAGPDSAHGGLGVRSASRGPPPGSPPTG